MDADRIVRMAGVAALIACAGSGPLKDDHRRALDRANEAFREGRVAEAQEAYERLGDRTGPNALVLHNRALALAAQGEHGMAEQLLRKADELALSDDVRSSIRQSLGRSTFESAKVLLREDPHRSIEMLDQAAEAYRSALLVDPDNGQIRRNVETCRRAAQLVRDQLRLRETVPELAQRQRSQADRNRPEDAADTPTEQEDRGPEPGGPPPEGTQPPAQNNPEVEPAPADPGDSDAPESESLPPAERPASETTDQEPSEMPPGGLNDQRSISEETQDASETMRQAMDNGLVAGDEDFASAVKSALDAAREEQLQAEDRLEQNRPSEASEHQGRAAELLEMAQRMLQRGQPQPGQEGSGEQQQRGDQDQQNQQDRQQGDQPAGDPLADALLEKERKERQERMAYQRSIRRGRDPVARDW
ncbi:MAG: hypothetical protein H6811_10030 [Phycisphaeraceae bacterium]|nr:hypothetical protein [Phycisphaeraceae bacterium]